MEAKKRKVSEQLTEIEIHNCKMNSSDRRIIFKNEEIFNERHHINNKVYIAVVMYCVGLPLPRPDVNPVTDMYNWYLSTFKRQLEVVSKII